MKIGLLGIGTVGTGVVKVLQENREQFNQTLSAPLEITHVFSRNPEQQRQRQDIQLDGVVVTDDIQALYQAELDLVVEVMGGVDYTREIVSQFLSQGVPVVTANKDMLALHIDELSELANAHQTTLLYEASVAGGIPIINAIETGLASNQFSSVMGILNGTTNYMLTRMTQDGWSYEQALETAQEKGFAEADPTNDVGGFDASRKIALLSRLAYQSRVQLSEVAVKGIDGVEALDIKLAKAAGYTMKLLGKSQLSAKGMQISVEPVFLADSHPLAGVSEAFNAVYVEGNAIGQAMFWGPGAGSLPTASAVVADVLQIAQRGYIVNKVPTQQLPVVPNEAPTSYYLRFDQDEVHVRAVLQTLAIGYVTLHNEQQLVIKTETITPTQQQQLVEHTHIVAMYPIVEQ